MDEVRTPQPTALRRHLLSPEIIARAMAVGGVDLARGHKQGNGVRVHGLYFALVSLVALLLIVASIVLASTMTNGFAATGQ